MDPIARMVAAGAAGASGGGDPIYVDDVFSTYLYTGNDSTQTINNGIDISGEGGFVWIKDRDSAVSHVLAGPDLVSAGYTNLAVDLSNAAGTETNYVTSFSSNGFSVGNSGSVNGSPNDYVSWTFRKAPGFLDIVTYSGTGSAQSIAHSLGSEPGMIWYKPIDDSREWMVYHRSLGASQGTILNMNIAAFSSSDFGSGPTSTHFSVGNTAVNNTAGKNYVAYIFAHDDQSFGTNSDEAIIKCGSYTGAANTVNSVELGFEPQWLMIKNTSRASDSYGVADWWMGDIMRQMSHSNARALRANTNAIEYNGGKVYPTATGFAVDTEDNIDHSTQGDNYIYMAIRRPHKPPTAGTEVFSIAAASSYQAPVTIPCDFAPDFFLAKSRTNTYGNYAEARLTEKWMQTNSTSSEDSNNYFYWDGPGGKTTLPSVDFNDNPVYWQFRRAPGFFDVVAYTGGSTTYTHNLGAVPELMIIKVRNGGGLWYVYSSVVGNSKFLRLNGNQAESTGLTWTTPTATEFTAFAGVNASHENYIVYLFATLDGVSKIGSYTGTNASIDIDCGFTAGARFVLIKRTNSTGDWYLFDSVRGIVSGDDPYILLNSSAAQVNGFNPISPLNSGFTVNSPATAGELNDNGGTYLFLAIA